MSLSTITYSPAHLNIQVHTTSPATVHANLLNGLVACLGYAISNPDKPKSFADDLMPVIELLQALQPDEAQLEKMYNNC